MAVDGRSVVVRVSGRARADPNPRSEATAGTTMSHTPPPELTEFPAIVAETTVAPSSRTQMHALAPSTVPVWPNPYWSVNTPGWLEDRPIGGGHSSERHGGVVGRHDQRAGAAETRQPLDSVGMRLVAGLQPAVREVDAARADRVEHELLQRDVERLPRPLLDEQSEQAVVAVRVDPSPAVAVRW